MVRAVVLAQPGTSSGATVTEEPLAGATLVGLFHGHLKRASRRAPPKIGRSGCSPHGVAFIRPLLRGSERSGSPRAFHAERSQSRLGRVTKHWAAWGAVRRLTEHELNKVQRRDALEQI
jgi:hypothetical protein